MAESKVYHAFETAIVFKDSGGDYAITLQNLGFGAGRVSPRVDRGTGSKPGLHKLRATVQFETAAVIDEVVEFWLFESDGTDADGTVGTTDAALTSVKRKNGKFIGAVVVESTSTATDFTASFNFLITARYYSIGVWNASAGDNMKNTANANHFSIQAIPLSIQASA